MGFKQKPTGAPHTALNEVNKVEGPLCMPWPYGGVVKFHLACFRKTGRPKSRFVTDLLIITAINGHKQFSVIS